ncbi:hypothetical protein [Uliginosibacterium sp. TH139]|uniref:hypothetical protein n=1 Tax=Uliginosibacterium sp. TH139 TaxID=2067453 RepID=UPI000C7C089B|nr:hypothetical protein [Uliginosibacterium sp. TH139]PLK49608.1 hypothetical protein C0V76_04030 [Uliginosibacterium sp. TH139]
MRQAPPDLGSLLRDLLPALAAALGYILWLGLQAQRPQPWQLALLLAASLLCLWMGAYRRYRHYADTPSAPIASAPQGYIAIEGIGRALPGEPLRSPLNYLPCLWYRIVQRRKDGQGHWHVERDETSDASFFLEDEDGNLCSLDPRDARIEAVHKDEIRLDDCRSTQWLLIPGTRLFAIGHFESRRPIEDRASAEAELRDKLSDWKRDRSSLMQFDTDRNGELDQAEWERARAAARTEVLAEREAAADFPPYHCLREPADGRPFVISDHPREQVIAHLQRRHQMMLAAFFLALLITAWLASHA